MNRYLAILFAVTPALIQAEDIGLEIYPVYAWGEFLYWRPIQTEHEVKCGYRPAFRVGIGMELPRSDHWTLSADYTWYHHKFTKNATEQSQIKNVSTFDYDIVGINVQRLYCLGQRTILSPFLALKWMHRVSKIRQDVMRGDANDISRAFIHWDSIGLATGFDGSCLLGWNLRLIGKTDIGLMYAYHSKFSQIETFNLYGLDQTIRHFDKHFDLLARGGLGIGWGNYFSGNRYHLDLALTYDLMADIPKLTYSTGMMENQSSLFMGWTVRGQFDF